MTTANAASRQSISPPKRIGGVIAGTEALALRKAAEDAGAPLIYVTASDRDLQRFLQVAGFFLPDYEILAFPAWDTLPYDRAAPQGAIIAERVATLVRLASAKKLNGRTIIATTVSGFLQKLPPANLFKGAEMQLKAGKEAGVEDVQRFLEANGYRRSGKVMEPGEYSIRGSILDIFPGGQENAVRLDYFGDEIESIKFFDPLTQRSVEDAGTVTLYPVSEILLNEARVTAFREGYRERFGVADRDDTLYAAVSQGQYWPGMEHWLALFYERLESLPDYAPEAAIVLDSAVPQTLEERQELIRDYYEARIEAQKAKQKFAATYHPVKPEEMFLSAVAVEVKLERKQVYQLTPFRDEGKKDTATLDAQPAPKLNALAKARQTQPFALLAEEAAMAKKEGRSVVIAGATAGSANRLEQMLGQHDLHSSEAENWQRITGKAGLWRAVLPLESGFITGSITLLTEQDILGHRILKAKKRKKNAEAFIQEATGFEVGALLVHQDHGIGRFEGLVTLEVNGARHDCLKLVYKDEDKLFLPVENMELISRYGEEASAELDKLGAGSWQSRKARMKEKIRMAAEELMKIAAERSLKAGQRLTAAPGTYEEFAARFPYNETEDQQRSIDEVEVDLASGRPMDRLVCGDVGFGKTEVALRATFIAAADPQKPAQVALIAPTTLLARQHFRTFRARFEGTGLNVQMLSRLTPAKTAKETREGLKDGSVDVVIGTHAILSKQVEFARLGLLIVDEEQHFGVKQKEAIKSMKANVHVLTLSATPIPRTLQLALAGVRELSLITTPPVDRLAVRSFVMPFDPVVIREAIEREIHRGGQVFYVTPRIADIPELKHRIQALVPNARLAIANGQMAATQLDEVMNDFYDGKFDILLSTAIVESGIDIPTANTMIINRADMFGLSQLYQLRGRVGRSKTRAYAYFILPNQHRLGEVAMKRLEVMQTLDTLGAGFSLASHDMDIRGFGNLVGEEQSGHIKEVGVELYQHMLTEAVDAARAARGQEAPAELAEQWSPQINLGLSVMIPEGYVNDLTLRLSLYRRAAALASEEDVDSFAAELSDRFGPPPQEVEHLLDVIRLKQRCHAAGIERIDTGPKGAVFSFHQNRFARPEALIGHIAKHSDKLKLRADQKLVVQASWDTEAKRLKGVRQWVDQIAALAQPPAVN